MKDKSIVSLILVTFVVLATAAICVAQSTNHSPASSSNSTPSQLRYERIRSFTGASNLSDAETSALINASLKTNAAVQVWARMHFSLAESDRAADIAQVVRALESRREGNTNDAIRRLEAKLDDDIIFLNLFLTLGESEPVLKLEPRAQDLDVLQRAREYRLKYAHKSGDPLTEARVQEALSLGEKK